MHYFIALEQEEPAAVNKNYFLDYKRKFQARYKAARLSHHSKSTSLQMSIKVDNQNDQLMNDTLYCLRSLGLEEVRGEDLFRLIPGDQADDAIEIMSEVRAYYQGMHHSYRSDRTSRDPTCSRVPAVRRLHPDDNRLRITQRI